MEHDRRQRKYSVIDDPTPVYFDKKGLPVTAGAVAQVFAHSPADRQELLAIACVDKHISPPLVMSWITDPDTKDKFIVWCKGTGINLDQEQDKIHDQQQIHPILAQDADLIQTLGPYVRQIDLARIMAVRRYREEDPKKNQALVCGTYRLLGDYLGARRYYRRDGQTPRLLSLPDLPDGLFDSELISEILFESEREAALPIFNRNLHDGFKYLLELKLQIDNPTKIQFIEKLEKYFRDIEQFSVPGFKSWIAGSHKDIENASEQKLSPYPSFHQREYAYRFVHKEKGPVDLLVGGTGTMKTGGAIYAIRAAGAQKTLVVCPSSLRDNWEREIKEKHDEQIQVIKIESEKDLGKLIRSKVQDKPGYIIISYALLSRLKPEEANQILSQLVQTFSGDSLIVDEVHLAKEAKSKCTQQLVALSRLLPRRAPRIAMTATAVVNTVDDLDAPVRTLMPYDFPDEGDFTRAARNDPELVSALLHGEKIMTRWSKESLLDLPPLERKDIPVVMSPFHQYLYEYVFLDNTIEAQVKRGMLRQVALDPLLVRRHYYPVRVREMIEELRQKQLQVMDDREREIVGERIKALEERTQMLTTLLSRAEALLELNKAHEAYIQWSLTQNPSEVFDEDFLVKMGFGKLAVWSFFMFPNGVGNLVKQSANTLLKRDWNGKAIFSSKYLELKKLLDERLASRSTKVLIFSGFYQDEVSSGIEDISSDDELGFLSLYDLLRIWYGDDSILKIDGSVLIEPKKGEITERDKVRRVYRLNPDKKVLLATTRASRLGIDLSIPSTAANQYIKKTTIIHIDLPDTAADIDQDEGRMHRPGQQLPIESLFLKYTHSEQPRTFRYGFIDHGIWGSLEFKRLLSQMVLDAVPLTEEEEKFVRSHLSNLPIDLYPTTPQSYLNSVVFLNTRGKGYQKNQDFFKQVGFEGMTNADFFADYYTQNESLSLAGHNSRLVAQIFQDYQTNNQKDNWNIASVGAGSGILQRTLGQDLVNIDMLFEISVLGQSLQNDAKFIVGDGANLPLQSGLFDITDASLMLHWSSNLATLTRDGYMTERAKILFELNRITKNGGLVTITVPSTHLNSEQFSGWKEALETYFGFRLSHNLPSGLVTATDFRKEPISWIFNLVKVSEPRLGFLPKSLSFAFEELVGIIAPGRRSNGQNGRLPSISQAIPHFEFEIYQPGTGTSKTLSFKPNIDEDIETALLGKQEVKLTKDPIEIYRREGGGEEFSLYRRLVKVAKNRLGLNSNVANKLALQTISFWQEHGEQKHNVSRIWTEVNLIMEDLLKGGKYDK